MFILSIPNDPSVDMNSYEKSFSTAGQLEEQSNALKEENSKPDDQPDDVNSLDQTLLTDNPAV